MAMHPTLPSLPLPQSLLQLLLLCCCPGGARAPLPPLGEGGHKLTYFEFAGRAESIRIALFAAGIDFQDDRVKYADYQTMKADTDDYTWQNGLPVLSIGKYDYTQSLAQLRYAGKKSGLYPADAEAALAVDEVLDIVQDILTKAPYDDDLDTKIKKRAEYAAPGGKMHLLTSLMQQKAAANPGRWKAAADVPGPWMVGSDMTIADLAFQFSLAKMLRDGDFDGVAPAWLDQFPALAELEQAVPKHLTVQKYYKTVEETKKEEL